MKMYLNGSNDNYLSNILSNGIHCIVPSLRYHCMCRCSVQLYSAPHFLHSVTYSPSIYCLTALWVGQCVKLTFCLLQTPIGDTFSIIIIG